MSFVRRPDSRQRPSRPNRRKPGWDDTVNDLTVYKATPDEIAHRKISHMSTNRDVVKEDQFKKVIRKAKLKEKNNSNVERRKATILKEVIMDQSELQDVLIKSDRAISIVQDLFGDDPKRFTGFPNVTTAPGAENKQNSFNKSSNLLPVAPDLQSSQLEHLSNSIMNSSALNDLENNSQSDSEEEQEHFELPATFVSQLDLNRFQNFLQSELNEHAKQPTEGKQATKKTPESGGDVFEGVDLTEDSDCEPVTVVAINDTAKVKKVKSVIPECEKVKVNLREQETELKQVLDGVQQSLPESTHVTKALAEDPQKSDSALGHAILKLVQCLKETERRLQTESTLREQLSQDVYQLRTWVDALTADLITCQEHYAQLESEFCQYRQVSQLQICQLQEKCGVSPDEVKLLVNQHLSAGGRLTSGGRQAKNTIVSTSSQPDSNSNPKPAHLQESPPGAGTINPGVVLSDGLVDAESRESAAAASVAAASASSSVGASSHASQVHPAAAILLSPPRQTHTPAKTTATKGGTVKNDDQLKQNLLGQFDELVGNDIVNVKKISERPLVSVAPPTVQVRVPVPIPLNSGHSSFPHQHSIPPHPHQHNQHLMLAQPYASGDGTSETNEHLSNMQTRQNNPSSNGFDDEQLDLEKELAELTRQHADAQTKLQSLLLQNGLQKQMTGADSRRVSPPLSPISQASALSAMLLPQS